MARKSLQQRFDEQVDRSGEHHVWIGAKNADRGTGRLKVAGRNTTAHRTAWELAHGALPPGLRVATCPGDAACVRVEHLGVKGDDIAPTVAVVPPRRGARGGGSKRQVRPGRWELTVGVRSQDERGRPRRVFRRFEGTEAEATKALAAFMAEVGTGDSLPLASAAGLTVEVLLDEYLSHLDQDKGRKHSTLVRYGGLAGRGSLVAG